MDGRRVYIGAALVGCLVTGGCGRYEVGSAVLCLGKDSDASVGGSATVSGVVGDAVAATEDLGSVFACETEPSRTLVVEDGEAVWFLSWGAWDPEGLDLSRPMDLEVGDPVELVFDGDSGGEAAGAVLRSSGELVAAWDVGVPDPSLTEADLPEISVITGKRAARHRLDCGRSISYDISFAADDVVDLEPVRQTTIEVGGVPFMAQALRNVGPEGAGVSLATCAEIEAEIGRVWTVSRVGATD